METLIALGSISALLLTMLNIVKLFGMDSEMDLTDGICMIAHSAEAAATVISIMIIGKYIEDRAKENIRKHAMRAFPDDRLKSNSIIKKIKPRNKKFDSIEDKLIDVGLIEKDDICELSEGMLLLLDCVIVYGEVEVNENITFGDLSSRIRSKGEKLKSGCEIKRILSNKCVVMVEEVLEESLIFKVTKEMSMSINQKLKFQFFLVFLCLSYMHHNMILMDFFLIFCLHFLHNILFLPQKIPHYL